MYDYVLTVLDNLDGVLETDYIQYEDTHCHSNADAYAVRITNHQECKDLCSDNNNCKAAEVNMLIIRSSSN